jgi:tRNA 2-selenouridine synthase
VISRLSELPANFEFRVVHGPTGSGKSRLLASLRRAGAQVLDLEDLAAHRGSVLGGLPERAQPSQKMFESLLLRELSALDAARPVFVEGESKKIGQLHVPEALIERMRESECVRLESGLETRVDLLMGEYRHFLQDGGALGEQLDCLAALHGRERIAEWKALAAAGEWRALVARLLVEHYDPAYHRSSTRNFPRLADAEAVRVEAAGEAAFSAAADSLFEKTMEPIKTT